MKKILELEHFSEPFFKRLTPYEILEINLTFYNQPTPLASTQTFCQGFIYECSIMFGRL
jgi:hypothetical protein